MFWSFIRVVVVIIMIGCLTPASLAKESDFEITIPQAKVPPKIDGKLDDPLWSAFEPVEWGNINEGGEVEADRFSRSWAAYDENFIYVAFENLEPNTGKITTVSLGHDKDVWNDDENEIFIEPNNAGTEPYFHIMINAEGTTQDAESGGDGDAWEADLKRETLILKDRWNLEVRIPFVDLGVDKAPVGATWGWNFNRHIMAGDDIWTSWAITGASFHTPDKFGNLTFGIDKLAVEPAGKLAVTWGHIKAVR